MRSNWIFLYGPPGVGKSSVGQLLAEKLDLDCWDLDQEIERQVGETIPEIFAKEGERAFRDHERRILREIVSREAGVCALGGGALVTDANRAFVEEHGEVVFLEAEAHELLKRLRKARGVRPLLARNPLENLLELLRERADHYTSFDIRIGTNGKLPEQVAWEIQRRLGQFRLTAMGQPYRVLVRDGALSDLGHLSDLEGLAGDRGVVSDHTVWALYGEALKRTLGEGAESAVAYRFPPGEDHKTLQTVQSAWDAFLEAGLDRSSVVLALGGGVVGDLAGFAAATYMRGIDWVNIPTSLLAMVDASIGGKTGVDLPQGKNLIGAFHAPRIVVIDPEVLDTLAGEEIRSGLAEVVKHGIIADPDLFQRCARGLEALESRWEMLVRRAIAVKIRIVEQDPYEQDRRQVLNLGHTVGHAVEHASGYALRHGEAVAIGMVAEARLAEEIGLAEKGLAGEIASVLENLGLPTKIPLELDPRSMRRALTRDKKKSQGRVRFALPIRVGEVRPGIEIPNWEKLLGWES
jgi:3-dehydroquinate synthase